VGRKHVGEPSRRAPALDTGGGTPVPQNLNAGLRLTASPVDGGIACEGESITLPDLPGTGVRALTR
jgi:hypothetical protein